MSSHDPYGSIPAANQPIRSMNYGEPFSFFFQAQNWGMNLLYASICQLIPVVGPIVLLGYKYEVIESLHYNDGKQYPDFDFNRFVVYLSRGVWPFLVQLLVSMITIFPCWLLMVLPMVLVGAAANGKNDGTPVIALGISSMMFLVVFIAGLAMMLVLVPMILRAGLAQEFGAAFDFGFVLDFIKKMWLEMILSAIVTAIGGIVLVMIGFAICCVGAYATATLAIMAHAHFEYQLYELFLQRGGQPIPLKPVAAT